MYIFFQVASNEKGYSFSSINNVCAPSSHTFLNGLSISFRFEYTLHSMKMRCPWVTDDPIYQQYHDEEWGRYGTSDRDLFEALNLEGAQAGLSWLTVLKKREGYRNIFHHFDIQSCADLTDAYLEEALLNPSIIRNRLKVYGVRKNALATLKLLEEFPSLHAYFWSWIDGKPIQNTITELADYPSSTELSDKISKDLKKRGFTFVGSTIIYAFMQAVGMVQDHTTDCYLCQH